MRVGKSKLAIVFALGAVSACAPAPVPVPPPPILVAPPPPPRMPLPPSGASATMIIPAIGFDGVRMTPNRGISADENIWHFRSALNVAALTCQGPVWGQIATNYNQMLKTHKSRLTQTDKSVDAQFKKQYPGQNALRLRDTKLTDLYNYFALPPVKTEYCDVALQKSQEVLAMPSSSLPEYAFGALGDVDAVFIRFFDAYAAYEAALADWNQKYAPQPVINFSPISPIDTLVTQPAPFPSPGS